MSGLMTIMTLVLCIAMLGAALLALREPAGDAAKTDTEDLPIAILAAGLVSLIASVLFLILAAPDVAMTEAAIGSGITTFLFFFVLGRIRRVPDADENSAGDGNG
jgi:energy-converting hydrogenase B subunit D